MTCSQATVIIDMRARTKGGIMQHFAVFWVNIIGRIGDHLINHFDLGDDPVEPLDDTRRLSFATKPLGGEE